MAKIVLNAGLDHSYTPSGSDVNSTVRLTRLSDVTITSVANNEILKYNSSNSQWENVNATSIVLLPLNNITDVSAPNPNNGDIIVFNSSNATWESTNEIDGGTY